MATGGGLGRQPSLSSRLWTALSEPMSKIADWLPPPPAHVKALKVRDEEEETRNGGRARRRTPCCLHAEHPRRHRPTPAPPRSPRPPASCPRQHGPGRPPASRGWFEAVWWRPGPAMPARRHLPAQQPPRIFFFSARRLLFFLLHSAAPRLLTHPSHTPTPTPLPLHTGGGRHAARVPGPLLRRRVRGGRRWRAGHVGALGLGPVRLRAAGQAPGVGGHGACVAVVLLCGWWTGEGRGGGGGAWGGAPPPPVCTVSKAPAWWRALEPVPSSLSASRFPEISLLRHQHRSPSRC
jgi:hypothetical protein